MRYLKLFTYNYYYYINRNIYILKKNWYIDSFINYIYICTCTIYDIIWIFILVYLVLNAEMKYENAIEINFNREIFVSLTIYIYNKFIALMKAQTWWKGSKTFRIRNERSWFYYFVIFLYKKKKQFHHNFASQPLFNSSSSFRLKIIFNVEKIHSKLYISSIFSVKRFRVIIIPSILRIFHQNYAQQTFK